MERAGGVLDRVASVFFHLVGADTNDEIQAIEREIAPILARERNAVYLDDSLFQRVEAVYASREGRGLDSEAVRLIERYRLAFVRSGAGLPADKKARLAEIGERLATLGATFGQNVLADEKDFLLVLEQPRRPLGAAGGVSRRRPRRRRPNAAIPANMRSRSRVPRSSRSCNSRPGAISGRRCSGRSSRAARTGARTTTAPS